MKKTFIYTALLLSLAARSLAQAPQSFNYQGVARSASGTPLASTTLGLRLTIHDGSATGTTVYQETQTPVTNAFGLYNVAIGSGTAVSGTLSGINWGSGDKYLQVEIDPAGGTSYSATGTSQLQSVPYAVYANTANTATTATTAAALSGTVPMGGDVSGTNAAATVTKIQGQSISTTAPTAGQVLAWNSGTSSWTPTTTASGLSGSGTVNYLSKFTSGTAIGNSTVFDNGSTVGINTSIPSNMAKLHVSGIGTYSVAPYYQAGVVADGSATAANGTGVYGESGWRGVYGRNPGTAGGSEAMGVLGRIEGSSYTGYGYGVKGECVGTGGTANYGVYGTASGTAVGVAGVSTGTGAAGKFDGGSTGAGIIVTNGASGFGTATPINMGKVEISGVGTYSVAPIYQAGLVVDGTSTLNASAVFGQGGWKGVYGYNPGTYAGVAAIGVQGNVVGGSYTSAGYGLYGTVTGTGPSNYGVYATASGATGTNYAGYFQGTLYATSASSSIKAFKIDDPRDPANKYLYHSSVESNEMMDLYKGTTTTDANGDATVSLPSYFSVLNKSYDYQLTCIGQFAQAIVAEEVSNNQFKIKTDKPNVKVSWMVSGVRQDPAANAYRVKDEVEKPATEKGTYLMPELYGFGPDKAPGYMDESNGNKPKGTK